MKFPGWLKPTDDRRDAAFEVRRWHPGFWLTVARAWWAYRKIKAAAEPIDRQPNV